MLTFLSSQSLLSFRAHCHPIKEVCSRLFLPWQPHGAPWITGGESGECLLLLYPLASCNSEITREFWSLSSAITVALLKEISFIITLIRDDGNRWSEKFLSSIGKLEDILQKEFVWDFLANNRNVYFPSHSQALCQTLEETVSDLQDRLREKEGELTVLRTQINFLMVQQQTLVKALR